MSEKINQIEPEITAQDIDEVTKYLSSGSWITEHKITGNLEDQISNTVGRKHSVAGSKWNNCNISLFSCKWNYKRKKSCCSEYDNDCYYQCRNLG